MMLKMVNANMLNPKLFSKTLDTEMLQTTIKLLCKPNSYSNQSQSVLKLINQSSNYTLEVLLLQQLVEQILIMVY